MSEEQAERFLQYRIKEELEWMQDNMDADLTEQDALDHLLGECGQTSDGYCRLEGSEYCDFECPFNG